MSKRKNYGKSKKNKRANRPPIKYKNYRNIRANIQAVIDGEYNTKEKIKTQGEVFTSFNLIEEMLNKLPKDVWSNPTKTWLDPAAGIGNFHCVVVERLMERLSDWEPNEEKRYKHIIENQLYFVEINPESVAITKRLFNPQQKYKMNLVCADFLDEKHPGWDDVGHMWNAENKRIRNIKHKFF